MCFVEGGCAFIFRAAWVRGIPCLCKKDMCIYASISLDILPHVKISHDVEPVETSEIEMADIITTQYALM